MSTQFDLDYFDIEQYQQDVTLQEGDTFYVFCSVITASAILGVIGNACFYFFFGNASTRNYNTRDAIYIRRMSIFDMLVCIIVLPYSVFNAAGLVRSHVVCKGMEFIRHTLTYCSHLMLVSYSFELSRRHGYARIKSNVNQATIVMCTLAGLFSVPTLFLFGVGDKQIVGNVSVVQKKELCLLIITLRQEQADYGLLNPLSIYYYACFFVSYTVAAVLFVRRSKHYLDRPSIQTRSSVGVHVIEDGMLPVESSQENNRWRYRSLRHSQTGNRIVLAEYLHGVVSDEMIPGRSFSFEQLQSQRLANMGFYFNNNSDKSKAPYTDQPNSSNNGKSKSKAPYSDQPKSSNNVKSKVLFTAQPKSSNSDKSKAPYSDKPKSSNHVKSKVLFTDKPKSSNNGKSKVLFTAQSKSSNSDKVRFTDQPETSSNYDKCKTPYSDQPKTSNGKNNSGNKSKPLLVTTIPSEETDLDTATKLHTDYMQAVQVAFLKRQKRDALKTDDPDDVRLQEHAQIPQMLEKEDSIEFLWEVEAPKKRSNLKAQNAGRLKIESHKKTIMILTLLDFIIIFVTVVVHFILMENSTVLNVVYSKCVFSFYIFYLFDAGLRNAVHDVCTGYCNIKKESKVSKPS